MTQYYADSDANGNIIAYYNDDIWDVTKIPSTAIKITEAQWQDAIANQGKYFIQSGALILAPAPTAAQQLSSAISTKLAALGAACQSALQSFTSNALGARHTYLSRSDSSNNDWTLFNGQYNYATSTFYNNKSFPWYTEEAGNVVHTKNQFLQIWANAHDAVSLRKNHLVDLETQVNSYANASDPTSAITSVNAIAWSDPWESAPTAPLGLAATAGAVGSGQATLTWTANTDDVMPNGGGYNVYVDGSATTANASLVTASTFTITGLTTGSHTLKITAVGANGIESAKCPAFTVTVS